MSNFCLHEKIYSLQSLVNDELVGLSEDEHNKLCNAINSVSEAAFEAGKENVSSHYEGDFVSPIVREEN